MSKKPQFSSQGLVIEREEADRQRRHTDQVEDRIEGILNKVESLEKSIAKIMDALKIKHWTSFSTETSFRNLTVKVESLLLSFYLAFVHKS